MASRSLRGDTVATGPDRRMQPARATTVRAAIIENRNARTTRTGVIPHNETAPVLHRLWLINRIHRVPDAAAFFMPLRGTGSRNERRRCNGPGLAAHHAARAARCAGSGERSSADAGADRAGHAGAAEATITG